MSKGPQKDLEGISEESPRDLQGIAKGYLCNLYSIWAYVSGEAHSNISSERE